MVDRRGGDVARGLLGERRARRVRRRDRSDARLRLPRRAWRVAAPGVAVERSAYRARGGRARGCGRPGATARDHRQPRAHRIPSAEDPVAARPRAGTLRAAASRLAPERLSALPALRRFRDGRIRRVRDVAARPSHARVVDGDPASARPRARAAPAGLREPGRGRERERRRGCRDGAARRNADRRRRGRQRRGGDRKRHRARGRRARLARHLRRPPRARRRAAHRQDGRGARAPPCRARTT